jgi:hypothetical protein
MDEKYAEMVRLLRMRAEILDLFDGPDPGGRVIHWLMKRRGGVLMVPPRSGGSPPRRRPKRAFTGGPPETHVSRAVDRARINATTHTAISIRNARSMMSRL